MEESGLWAARTIGEFAIVRAFFCYVAVEGVFLPSADTEQGDAVHRRVDQPSMMTQTDEIDDKERPKAVRSLASARSRCRLGPSPGEGQVIVEVGAVYY